MHDVWIVHQPGVCTPAPANARYVGAILANPMRPAHRDLGSVTMTFFASLSMADGAVIQSGLTTKGQRRYAAALPTLFADLRKGGWATESGSETKAASAAAMRSGVYSRRLVLKG